MIRTTEVAVVGGGPAGLSAATAAARAGLRTILLDENTTLGGQLRYRIAELDLGEAGRVRAYDLAVRLVREATDAGVDGRVDSVVWGLFADNVLGIFSPVESYQLRAERIILATGSTDVPYPFAGGSLPGVFPARAIQILLHVHRVLPGRRFAVIGDGLEAAEVVNDVAMAGGEVIVQLSPNPPGDHPAAEGSGGVQSLTVGGRRHEVDVVVVAIGRQPDCELGLMAECGFEFDAQRGGWVPVRDQTLTTTRPGILVAGDAAGICDVRTALAEGLRAGTAVAKSLRALFNAADRSMRI